MRGPVNLRKTETWRRINRWSPPDKEWLYDQYITQRKSADQVAREIGASHTTVCKWLEENNLPRSNKTAESSPYWRGGSSTHEGRLARRTLREVELPAACAFCGTVKGVLDVHHKDEDHSNNRIENLQWLCRGCHKQVHNQERDFLGRFY